MTFIDYLCIGCLVSIPIALLSWSLHQALIEMRDKIERSISEHRRLECNDHDAHRVLLERISATVDAPEVWGASIRFEVEVGTVILGAYVTHEPSERIDQVLLRVLPPRHGVLKEVYTYGGPWLIEEVAVGHLSLTEGSRGGVGDSCTAARFDVEIPPGNEIKIKLRRPKLIEVSGR